MTRVGSQRHRKKNVTKSEVLYKHVALHKDRAVPDVLQMKVVLKEYLRR